VIKTVVYLVSGQSKIDSRMCKYCDFYDKIGNYCLLLKMKGRCKYGQIELQM